MKTYFIADLHLSESRPDITHCFLEFIEQLVQEKPDALYVLGDLFELWIGDDEQSAFLTEIRSAFRRLTDSGVPCYYIHGNRDFMIGKRFAKQTGMSLLDEHTVISLYGKDTLILHGDTLCIDDENYQKYRRRVHQKWLQWLFMRLPLGYRIKIGRRIRSQSAEKTKTKSIAIMDVNQQAVEDKLQQYRVDRMIHGHTHRPNFHQHPSGQRIVLGDWYDQGSVLVATPNGDLKLVNRAFS